MAVIVDELKNMVTLDFPIDYYSYAAIMHAANDFTQNFWISLNQDISSNIQLSLEPKEGQKTQKINLHMIANEFYNYVLGMMQQLSK